MSSNQKQGLVESLGLNATELEEIKRIAQLCNQHEGLDLKLNLNILSKRPKDQLNDFLYYIDGQLVGFLALFSFKSLEGEISGMVHPAYRRRGIFSKLFESAGQEARRRSLPTLLLIAEQASLSAQAWVSQLVTTYDHGEYKMILEEPRLPTTVNQRLHFRHADAGDLQLLASITADAFGMPTDVVDWYTEKGLMQLDHLYYVGEVDGVVIGKIDVHRNKDADFILGFAVAAAYQGQGYGRHILACTVKDLLNRGQQNIWLEVSTENKHALSLYQSCGFRETGSYDYYRLALTK